MVDRQRDAFDVAACALRYRDLSTAAVGAKLRAAGFDAPAERAAVGRLVEAGLVDDWRLARARARALAERGLGDLAIEERLERDGIDRVHRQAAIAELEPEIERASAVVSKAEPGEPRRVAAKLAGRGFGAESVEAVLLRLDALGEPELP
jgi:SOS response regulatory protein OraA/RecX